MEKDKKFEVCILLTDREYQYLARKAAENGKHSIKEYLLDLASKDNGRRIG